MRHRGIRRDGSKPAGERRVGVSVPATRGSRCSRAHPSKRVGGIAPAEPRYASAVLSPHARRASLVAVASFALQLSAPLPARADVTSPFPGVTLVKEGGKALTVADLCRDGVSMRATKYGERKATPQAWAQGVGAQVAVNGDFFDFPGWTWVIGRARGAGESWPADKQNREVRSFWQFGPGIADLIEPSSTEPNGAATEVVGGHNTIIRGGRSLAPGFDGDGVILGAYRRTGVGLNGSRSRVFLFASNTALSGAAMADTMLAMAAQAGQPDLDVATNLDGGGSSQMYVAGQGQIVDSGRQVNNHLGIFAKGSGGTPNCWHRPPTMALPVQAGACGVIEGGQGLGPRQATSSCDGRFTLIQQSDGNLVLYGPVGKALWSTSTQHVDGYALFVQPDGNAVQYSAYGRAAWSSNTPGQPGARLVVQTDGNLVVYQGNQALWSSSTVGTDDMPKTPTQPLPAKPTACGKLGAGQGLGRDEQVVSCDGRFALKMQTDGNLVLVTLDGKALWASSTVSAVGYTATLGSDGAFTVNTPYQITVWSAESGSHPGAHLAIQDDGNLVVYEGANVLWTSNTQGMDAPYPTPPGQPTAGAGGQAAGSGSGGKSDAAGGGGMGGGGKSGTGSAGAGAAAGTGGNLAVGGASGGPGIAGASGEGGKSGSPSHAGAPGIGGSPRAGAGGRPVAAAGEDEEASSGCGYAGRVHSSPLAWGAAALVLAGRSRRWRRIRAARRSRISLSIPDVESAPRTVTKKPA